MKQFIIRVFFFIGLLFLTLFLLRQSVPFYWTHPIIQQKMKYVIDNPSSYNTYFIGSSSIYRQMNPIIFDKETQLKSFNLGFDAMFFLEAHFLTDHFLAARTTIEPITVFLSETAPHPMVQQNLHTARNKYYMDFKRLKMAWNHYWPQKNYLQLYYHSLSYLENQLMLGEIGAFLSYHFKEPKKIQSAIIEQQGFYPMGQELKLEQKQNLQNNRTAFLKSNRYLNGKNLTDQEIATTQLTIPNNLSNYNNINKGTATFHQIPIFINLGPKYEFDAGHLNTEGSAIFSQKFGEVYNRLVKRNN